MAIQKNKNNTILTTPIENSSIIVSVTYDLLMNNLLITFKNSNIYEYVNVPKEEYDALIAAESIGKHFAQNIKNKYEWLRVAWWQWILVNIKLINS